MSYQKTIFALERCKHENELAISDWKEKCLAKEKEDERKRLQEWLSLPHNNNDVIIHLNEFISSSIRKNFSELLDEYYGMYEKLFADLDKEKYSKTIKNVFDVNNSKKVMSMFIEHNKVLENRLMYLVNYVKSNQSDKFILIENELKKSFDKFINDHFMNIYNFLYRTLNQIEASIEPFNNSTALKTFARMIISQINQKLIEGLPQALTCKFEDYYLTLKERIFGEDEVQDQTSRAFELKTEDKEDNGNKVFNSSEDKQTVLKLELTLDSFMTTIPDGWIEITELREMYNKYFGTNLSNNGFSKLKQIQELFSKKVDRKKGKKVTFYMKNV